MLVFCDSRERTSHFPPVGGFPEKLLVGGKLATPRILPVDPNSDKTSPRLTIASLTMYVIRRGERYALRIKDSQSAALTGFHGLNWYEPNPKYRLTARWLPYKPPRTTSLSTLIGTHYSQPVPGVAEFELDGKTYRLEPVIEDPEEEKLFFILRDATSKSTTYAACRFLYTPHPDHDSLIPAHSADFNKIERPSLHAFLRPVRYRHQGIAYQSPFSLARSGITTNG